MLQAQVELLVSALWRWRQEMVAEKLVSLSPHVFLCAAHESLPDKLNNNLKPAAYLRSLEEDFARLQEMLCKRRERESPQTKSHKLRHHLHTQGVLQVAISCRITGAMRGAL